MLIEDVDKYINRSVYLSLGWCKKQTVLVILNFSWSVRLQGLEQKIIFIHIP